MNQIFAWLVFIGMIVGVYTALSEPLKSESAAPQAIEQAAPGAAAAAAAPAADDKRPASRMEALKNQGKKLSDSVIKMPETAVDILLKLIGPMALWLGIMKIAEEAGLIRLLALALQPILRPLFPRIPAGHPALGAIILDVSANMLGTGNAATPLGLKAMNELQKLNKEKDIATDAMIMFLAINTSSVTIIPFTTAAFRSSAGSTNPFSFLIPTLLATIVSTAVAIAAVTFFKRFSRPPDDYFDELAAAAAEGGGGSAIDAVYDELQEKQREKENK